MSDAEALNLIEFPGKLGNSGKRPKFRLVTKQQRLLSYPAEVDGALLASGHDRAWLHRRVRGKPFSGRSPLSYMIEEGEPAVAEVLRHLNRAGLQASLRADATEQ